MIAHACLSAGKTELGLSVWSTKCKNLRSCAGFCLNEAAKMILEASGA